MSADDDSRVRELRGLLAEVDTERRLLDRVEANGTAIGRVDVKVDDLRDDLPDIVGTAVKAAVPAPAAPIPRRTGKEWAAIIIAVGTALAALIAAAGTALDNSVGMADVEPITIVDTDEDASVTK